MNATMKLAKILVAEKIIFTREILVKLPDGMSESNLEALIARAERRNDHIDDFVIDLERAGIKLTESLDRSLDSPDEMEIECTEFEIIDEE